MYDQKHLRGLLRGACACVQVRSASLRHFPLVAWQNWRDAGSAPPVTTLRLHRNTPLCSLAPELVKAGLPTANNEFGGLRLWSASERAARHL
jgi:hypothetical protein